MAFDVTPLVAGATVDTNEGLSADVEPAVAAASGLRLVGLCIREAKSAAAVCTIRILNGATVAAGTGIMQIELAADTSFGPEFFGEHGIAADNGLTIEVVAGEADVYLYHKTVTPG